MSEEVSAFSAYQKFGINNKSKLIQKKKHKNLKITSLVGRKNNILKGYQQGVNDFIDKSHNKTNRTNFLVLADSKNKSKKPKLANGKLNNKPQLKSKREANKLKKTKNVKACDDETPPELVKHYTPLPNEQDFEPILLDSVEEGKKLFAWLIDPYNVDDFFQNVWEKKPLQITRKSTKYYHNIISTPAIDSLLRDNDIEFTKNIDITSYSNGKRETHNPVGRALPHIVWDYYQNACSIRLLNPQTYIRRLHLLNATLQEYFNSFVGANAYLTPPDSQGFAPHYDDIEAFILQIEGKKKWRVYKPRSEDEILPRFSSKNFDQSEIGEPILETVLEPGDLLYFPRGFIHQAVTIKGEHSLHVTLSCYQKNSWADLMEKMLSAGLQTAIEKCVELRRGLPLDLYDHVGLVHSDSNTPRRRELIKQIKDIFGKVIDHLPIDNAVDQMNKHFLHDALPPIVMEPERECTVFGDSDVMTKNGVVINRVEISPDTKIRLIRSKILRMVMEEETIRLYYYLENSKEYHGNELQFLEIEESMAPAVETLIRIYPEYTSVEQLEIDNDIDKIQLANTLWEKGLVMSEYPLPTIED